MRKLLTIALVLFLILGVNTAWASSKDFNIKANGKDIRVYDVNLELNNKKMESDYAPFILNDRTFVPVRLVAEYFKSEVEWIKESKSVVISKGNDKLIIKIDSQDAIKNGKPIKLDKDSIPLLVTYPNKEGKTVLPLRTISELLGYDVKWNGKDRLVSIKEPVNNSNKITEIKRINQKDRNDQIELKSTAGIKWIAEFEEDHNTLKLNFDGFVFDIDGKTSGTINIDSDLIQKIEYSNIDGNSSQMVVELKREVSQKIRALPNGEGINICFINKLTAIRPITYKGEGAILVEGVKSSSYNIIKLNNPYRYVIDIKDAELYNNVQSEEIPISLGFAQKIRASRFNPDANYDKNDSIVRLVLDSKDGINDGDAKIIKEGDDLVIIPSGSTENFSNFGDKTVISNGEEKKVEIQERKPRVTPHSKSDVVIYIDPGHGGKDSGAVSQYGDYEKTYALDISKRVNNILKNEGYNVSMTRTTDEYIKLYDRPDKANKADAHVFVSIHINSTLNEDAKGIETLYAPRDSTSVKYDPQYPLAKTIHEEVIKATGANSRGTKQRSDLVVLRLTEMPAVLVEAGFISNEEDLMKLNDPAYLEDCARGIANGIKKYIKETYGY